jgi:hypothetical protein
MRLGPQRLHDPYLIGRALAAGVEILVEADKFNLVPANADAEPKPAIAAAQHVERGRLLGDQRRLALRQDQHAGGKADRFSAAGEKREQYERVVVRGRGGADAPPLVIAARVGTEHMVGREQIRKAEALGGLRIVTQHGGSGADITDRY